MRKAIRIERTGDFGIRVAFTYSDFPRRQDDNRKAAQRVTQDLVSRLIDEVQRNQSNRTYQTAQFFKQRTDESVSSWEALNTQIRGLTPTDPLFDRLTLDRDLARKEYESLRQKLGEVQGLQEAEYRREGTNLGILDPASLPGSPDISATEIALYGLRCGLALGLIASLWLALRRASNGLLPAEIAPIH